MNAPTRAAGLLRVVPLLMMVVCLGHFNRTGIRVAGNEVFTPKLGISTDDMGLVYSGLLLFYTIAMLPGGWLVDRWGARRSLNLLMFASAVMVALTAGTSLVAQTPYALWVALLCVRSVMGIFYAPLHPGAARLVYEHVPSGSKSLVNGLVTFSATVGISLTYFVLGKLIDQYYWPPAYYAASAVTLIAAFLWWFGTRGLDRTSGLEVPPVVDERSVDPAQAERLTGREPTQASPVELKSYWEVIFQPSVIFISLSYLAQGYFQYLFYYWIDEYFRVVQKLPPVEVRGYSTLVTLAMGVGMVVGGYLTDVAPKRLSPRWRRAIVPFVSMVGSGVAFWLGLIPDDARVTLLAFTVSAALIGATEAAFWTTIVGLGGRFGASAGALMNTFGNAGGTISPSLTPRMSTYFAAIAGSQYGWRISLAIAGLIVIVGALFWCGVKPDERDT